MHEVDIKEQEIVKELRSVSGNNHYQVKHILEWAAFEPEEIEGVKVFYLPVLKLYVSVEE